jgi:hypothetical protein
MKKNILLCSLPGVSFAALAQKYNRAAEEPTFKFNSRHSIIPPKFLAP